MDRYLQLWYTCEKEEHGAVHEGNQTVAQQETLVNTKEVNLKSRAVENTFYELKQMLDLQRKVQ